MTPCILCMSAGVANRIIGSWNGGCIGEDRVIVTENARDFRTLVGSAELHPGLIILPALGREGTWSLLLAALAFLERRGEPMDMMVSHVLEVAEDGTIVLTPLS